MPEGTSSHFKSRQSPIAGWESYKEALLDKRINWFGYVQELTTSGRETWVRASKERIPSSRDFTFELDPKDQYADRATEGQRIRVEGDIKDIKKNTEGDTPPVQVWLKKARILAITTAEQKHARTIGF